MLINFYEKYKYWKKNEISPLYFFFQRLLLIFRVNFKFTKFCCLICLIIFNKLDCNPFINFIILEKIISFFFSTSIGYNQSLLKIIKQLTKRVGYHLKKQAMLLVPNYKEVSTSILQEQQTCSETRSDNKTKAKLLMKTKQQAKFN